MSDGNFDNNRQCCMAKGSGFLQYDSLPGEIKTGCMQTPKLGTRFCEKHLVDHQQLDKVWSIITSYLNLDHTVQELDLLKIRFQG